MLIRSKGNDDAAAIESVVLLLFEVVTIAVITVLVDEVVVVVAVAVVDVDVLVVLSELGGATRAACAVIGSIISFREDVPIIYSILTWLI